MNSSGVNRGYLSKGLDVDDFIGKVEEIIARQFNRWDKESEVQVKRSTDEFTLSVKIADEHYSVDLAREHAEELQTRGPYAVDKYLWNALQSQGFIIRYTNGNYLSYVFSFKSPFDN